MKTNFYKNSFITLLLNFINYSDKGGMLKHFQSLNLFQEYQRLAKLPVLSDADEKRILKILEIAENDDLLDSLITNFEYSLAEKEGFLEDKYIDYYKEQSEKLKNFIKNLPE